MIKDPFDIQIVDDNRIKWHILREQFKNRTCFVDEAEDGENGLSQLLQAVGKKVPFCLAIIEKRSEKMPESRHG